MENKRQPTPLILHGHFYQPPRENPQVDTIPKQSSAKPYPDWNERIYDTCYFPNAGSRYLDPYGKIERIINNYEYISFDFGPTLMTWMKSAHPATYELIIEADRSSVKRLSHGNALAQSFNHTILPLDHPRDARMQIDWGIADFIHRFGRDPEGMWLPEAAINASIVDMLSEAGIRFVILSPWQCRSWQRVDGTWADTEPVPYDTPFIIEGTSGTSVTAFFYHSKLSIGISFDHMLRDADTLYADLLAIRDVHHPALIHTATDGEIYGHHEPFGDMALAALIHKTQQSAEFSFTNYAAFLDSVAVERHATLALGDDGLGSSWSCQHGVARWYKHCGCHTGGDEGWNQQWRTPLRTAFQQLGASIDALYEQTLNRLSQGTIDAWALLKQYGSVVSGHQSVKDFLDRTCIRSGLPNELKPPIARLLAAQKFKLYSFTSCGWFFSDLGGLEPRQNIKYAVQAASLCNGFSQEDMTGPLLGMLQSAKSNRRSDGNGQTMAKAILDAVPGHIEAAGYFLLNRRFARPKDHVDRYGKFKLESYRDVDGERCELELHDGLILADYEVSITMGKAPDHGYWFECESVDQADRSKKVVKRLSIDAIPSKMLDEVLSWIDRSLSSIGDAEVLRIATDIEHYSMLLKISRSTPNEVYHTENMGTCLRALRSIFSTPNTLPWNEKRESIAGLLEFIRRRGKQSEITTATAIFSHEIDRVAQEISSGGFNYHHGSYMLDVLRLARSQGFQPSITLAQNAVYPYLWAEGKSRSASTLTNEVLSDLRVELNFS